VELRLGSIGNGDMAMLDRKPGVWPPRLPQDKKKRTHKLAKRPHRALTAVILSKSASDNKGSIPFKWIRNTNPNLK